jgi:hypothetical protein
MDEDRRAQRYDNMHPDSEESRFGWLKDAIYAKYEAWAPWLEDMYLKYFTRDNKASYVTRGTPVFPFSSLSPCSSYLYLRRLFTITCYEPAPTSKTIARSHLRLLINFHV